MWYLSMIRSMSNFMYLSKFWSLVLSSKVRFCCGVWGNLCSTPSSHRLQCWVSFFKEVGSRLRRNSQITWAALSGQGRDPQPVALNQQEATNSLYWWEPGDFWQPWPCKMFFVIIFSSFTCFYKCSLFVFVYLNSFALFDKLFVFVIIFVKYIRRI